MHRRIARALVLPAAAVPLALASPAAAATTFSAALPRAAGVPAAAALPSVDKPKPAPRPAAARKAAARPAPTRANAARATRLAAAQRAQTARRAQVRRAAAQQHAANLRRSQHLRLHNRITELQRRLRWAGVYAGPVNGMVTAPVAVGLRNVQSKFGLPYASAMDPTALAQLRSITAGGDSIPPTCRTAVKVLCIDKRLRVVRAVQNGRVVLQTDARFGRSWMPTREGVFQVVRKSKNHVSGAYGSPMPYSMFFWRGQAVHYSSGFARVGYGGTSHGCVNVRDMAMAAALFNWAPTGTRVVVFRS